MGEWGREVGEWGRELGMWYPPLCLTFVMLSRLFIAALWSPAGKGLTSWLSFVMFNCVFAIFHGVLGQTTRVLDCNNS